MSAPPELFAKKVAFLNDQLRLGVISKDQFAQIVACLVDSAVVSIPGAACEGPRSSPVENSPPALSAPLRLDFTCRQTRAGASGGVSHELPPPKRPCVARAPPCGDPMPSAAPPHSCQVSPELSGSGVIWGYLGVSGEVWGSLGMSGEVWRSPGLSGVVL
jgi:hypothetical protein